MLATPVFAQATGAAGGITSMLTSGTTGPVLMMLVMFGLFYFFLIRPQQLQQKRHMAMIAAVKRGDTVVLSSGAIGKVVRVEDAEVGVEIAQGVTVKVVKTMIHTVRAKGEPAPANDVKS